MSEQGETIVHIAGLTVVLGGRVIQRCAACGALLCDSKNAMAPMDADGNAQVFPTWEINRLVEVQAGQPTRSSLLPETGLLPGSFCLNVLP